MASYLEKIKARSKKSRAYKKFQAVGVEIGQLLGDEVHTSLYIKMAKMRNPDHLMAIAKDIAGRSRVRNKGAYFMRVVQETTH